MVTPEPLSPPRPPVDAPRASSSLFVHRRGRRAFLRDLCALPLRLQLDKRSREHLARNRRQLVVFAFDHISHTLNIDGVYEKLELDAFFAWTRQLGIDFSQATVLDIGANIGNHALYFADHFKRVISFEPHPRTFKVLALNAELAPNIVCHNLGLSDHSGTAVLSVNPSNIGKASITHNAGSSSFSVEIRTLDSMPGLEDVKLIKIDVEGHEHKVLSGARQTIRDRQPIILFEQHTDDFTNGQSPVVALLRELGYERFATLRKHPAVHGSFLKKALLVPLLRVLLGESIRIELENDLQPAFYPFIIALPRWLTLPHASV